MSSSRVSFIVFILPPPPPGPARAAASASSAATRTGAVRAPHMHAGALGAPDSPAPSTLTSARRAGQAWPITRRCCAPSPATGPSPPRSGGWSCPRRAASALPRAAPATAAGARGGARKFHPTHLRVTRLSRAWSRGSSHRRAASLSQELAQPPHSHPEHGVQALFEAQSGQQRGSVSVWNDTRRRLRRRLRWRPLNRTLSPSIGASKRPRNTRYRYPGNLGWNTLRAPDAESMGAGPDRIAAPDTARGDDR